MIINLTGNDAPTINEAASDLNETGDEDNAISGTIVATDVANLGELRGLVSVAVDRDAQRGSDRGAVAAEGGQQDGLLLHERRELGIAGGGDPAHDVVQLAQPPDQRYRSQQRERSEQPRVAVSATEVEVHGVIDGVDGVAGEEAGEHDRQRVAPEDVVRAQVAHKLGDCGVTVRVPQSAPAAARDLDDHDRRPVPGERAVRLRFVRRYREGPGVAPPDL